MNKDVLQAIMLAGEIPKNMQTTDNLVTEIDANSTDDQYPSAKGVYDLSRFRLINKVTLSEAATTISITKDQDGNSFNLSEMVVYAQLYYSASTSYNYCAFKANGVTTADANYGLNASGGQDYYNFLAIDLPGALKTIGSYSDWGNSGNGSLNRNQIKFSNSFGNGITSVSVSHAGSGTLGTGCVLTVWGR